jgi:hypothetical protein
MMKYHKRSRHWRSFYYLPLILLLISSVTEYFRVNQLHHSFPLFLALMTCILFYAFEYCFAYHLFKRHEAKHGMNFCKSIAREWMDLWTFLARYSHSPGTPLAYSATLTFGIFSCGISLTVLLVDGAYMLGYCSNIWSPSFNPFAFLHNPGIIVAFFLAVVSMLSLLNTEILKRRMYRPIETLNDLLDTLVALLEFEGKGEHPEWKKYGKLFYYVFDYSLATGHISSQRRRYADYIRSLQRFLCHHNVRFRAMVYKDDILKEIYKKLLHNIMGKEPDEDTLINYMLDAHDVLINHINRYISSHDYSSSPNNGNNPKAPINFFPFVNKFGTLKYKQLTKIWAPIYNVANEGTVPSEDQIAQLSSNQGILSSEEELKKTNANENIWGIIVPISEIGLTRFIVTNSFLIHFIATPASSDDEKANVPAGFFTQDVILIERFKEAFEAYWKEIALGGEPRQRKKNNAKEII